MVNPLAPVVGAAADATDHHYFDRVVSTASSDLIVAAEPGQYGPFNLISPPANVLRSVVHRIAVVGIPECYFHTRFYWTLLISTGSAQEFIADTLEGYEDGPGVATPTQIPGVRFAPFGYLDAPMPVNILVKQGSTLQLVIYGGDPTINRDAPNAVVRLQGVDEFSRGLS
jgi:hypothetical protein